MLLGPAPGREGGGGMGAFGANPRVTFSTPWTPSLTQGLRESAVPYQDPVPRRVSLNGK